MKKMFGFVAVLVAMSLVLTGCSLNFSGNKDGDSSKEPQTEEEKQLVEARKEIEPESWLKYSNKQFGVSWSYPDNWQTLQTTGQVLINVMSPTGGASMNISCFDMKKVEGFDEATPEEVAQINDVKIFAEKTEPGLINVVADYEMVSLTYPTISGLKTAKRIYKGTQSGIPIIGTQIYMIKDSLNCIFTFVSQESVYEINKDIAEKSGYTLKI